MKIPKRIQALAEDGLVDEVLIRLMSGKEADVYVVRCGMEVRCAKVYKEAVGRGFKQAALYQEGRKVRNSRQARAMENRSKFGREQQEESWHNAEVDALNRVANAGVRVPETYLCLDGVLLMELITDKNGEVAPRLCEFKPSEEQAIKDHGTLMQYIVRMLCAGVVHGDLSEFNVLVNEHGPVIIDMPQAVDAAGNNNAESMLERDVNNITRYYANFAPELINSRYAKEIWALYVEGELHDETKLTGKFEENTEEADLAEVMKVITAAYEEEQMRKERLERG